MASMAAILNINFSLLLLIKNSLNRSDGKSKMVAKAAILKVYFSILLRNRKANWLETW